MKKFNDQHMAGAVEGDHFHVRMRDSRAHAGLTAKDAANQIGLTDKHLRRIEAGAVGMVSDPKTLHRAGIAYGVSSVWLYGGNAAVPARLVPTWYAPSDKAAA